MRILHIISSVNPLSGGIIECRQQEGEALTRAGHIVEFVSVDAPDDAWVAACPLKTHALGPARLGYAYSPRLVPWLRANTGGYDSIIVNGLWQFPTFAAWLALRRSGQPYYVTPHGMLDPWFKQTFPLKHLKKLLYWRWADYRVLRDARAVLFTCEEERVLARQSFRAYQCNELVVSIGTSVPAGDPGAQRHAFFAAYPELQGKRLLLFLSRIHVKKGCDLLLDAFAHVAASDPSLHLVMAGPDQTGWQAQLEAQAQKLGIADRITWPGMLAGDLKWGAFHAADAFVLPSHQENFGIAVAEALACGLPVLISNKVNIWREIEADHAGIVAPDTTDGTTHLLRAWLALSEAGQQSMRRQAKATFLSRFEITHAAQSLLAVLNPHHLESNAFVGGPEAA